MLSPLGPSSALDFTPHLRADDVVTWPQGTGEPLGLTRRLVAQRHALPPLEVFVVNELENEQRVTVPTVAIAVYYDDMMWEGRAFRGGYPAARKRLDAFVREKLPNYAEGRNEPAAQGTSTMAAYLHFGQVSPVEIALSVREAASGGANEAPEKFLEELIVRREITSQGRSRSFINAVSAATSSVGNPVHASSTRTS